MASTFSVMTGSNGRACSAPTRNPSTIELNSPSGSARSCAASWIPSRNSSLVMVSLSDIVVVSSRDHHTPLPSLGWGGGRRRSGRRRERRVLGSDLGLCNVLVVGGDAHGGAG